LKKVEICGEHRLKSLTLKLVPVPLGGFFEHFDFVSVHELIIPGGKPFLYSGLVIHELVISGGITNLSGFLAP
jgi:hypothetical protein